MVLVSYKCKMKFKFVKYLFIIFVIAIICFAIYFINNKNKNNPNKSLEPQENSTQYAKDLKFGIANFDTINPLISSNKDILNLDQLIFEPLVKLKNDYKIELCLATEYAKTTPTTYIIKIDTTVKWQNGTYLSASDIAYTIAIIKQSNSIYLENVKNIVSTEVIEDRKSVV